MISKNDNINKNNFSNFLDFLVLLLCVHTIYAEDESAKEVENVEEEVKGAQFMMMPMGGGGCANTCMCRQRCAMIGFFIPCSCGVSFQN